MKITDLLKANLGKLAVPGKGGCINIPRAGSKDGKPSIGVWDNETAKGQPGWRFKVNGTMPESEVDDWIAECANVENPYSKRSHSTVKTKDRYTSLMARLEAGEFAETIGEGGPSVRVPTAVDGVAYVVCDAAGREIVREVRTNDGRKFLNHLASDGYWWSGLGENDLQDMLYNRQLVAAGDKDAPVFICEGPKDAKTMADMGFLAVSQLAGSSAKWNPEWNKLLAGRDVILMQDNDEAGEKRTDYLRGVLKGASRMFVVTFENMAEGADVTDWVKENHAKTADLATYIQGVRQPLPRKRDFSKMLTSLSAPAAVEEEPAYVDMDQAPAIAPLESFWADAGIYDDGEEFIFPDYSIDGVLPEIGVGMLTGASGTFKTFVGIDMVSSIASGSEFAGFKVERPGAAVYLGYEGNETIKPRIKAKLQDIRMAGKQLAIAAPTGLKQFNYATAFEELEASLRGLAAGFKRSHNADMVLAVIDTAIASGLVVDENDPVRWQEVFSKLKGISERLKMAIILVTHAGKDATAGARGSSANYSAADFEITLSSARSKITGETVGRLMSLTKDREGRTYPIAALDGRAVHIGYTPKGKRKETLVIDFDHSREAIDEALSAQADATAYGKKSSRKEGGGAGQDGTGQTGQDETRLFNAVLSLLDGEADGLWPEKVDGKHVPNALVPDGLARLAFMKARGIGDDSDEKAKNSARKAFTRSLRGLHDKGLINSAGGAIKVLK